MPSDREAAERDAPRLARGLLKPVAPYRWRQTVAAITDLRAVPDRGRPTPGGGWQLAVRLAGRVASVDLSPQAPSRRTRGEAPEQVAPGDQGAGGAGGAGGERAADRLEITLDGDDHDLAEAALQVTRFLALDLDLAPLVAEAQLDPAFSALATALHGFHPPRFRSAFQAACWTVVRQRTPLPFALATMERLTVLLGDAADGSNNLRLFPTPAAVLQGRPELLAASNNVRKVDRLVAVAEAFAVVDEERLRRAPYDEVLSWLKQIHGVGPWSAEQVMWRGLGRHERAPWLDTGALAAVSAVYTPGLTLVRGEARRLAASYRPLPGVWLAYLKARARVQDDL